MLLILANVAYVLIAIAMVVLILLQRGAGAAAGSGFGGGASATVFGARGSGNFLSKSTAVLATLFFAISLGMAMYASRSANSTPATDDLGVMAGMARPATTSELPADAIVTPSLTPASDLPPAPAPAIDAEAATAEPGADAAVEVEPKADDAETPPGK